MGSKGKRRRRKVDAAKVKRKLSRAQVRRKRYLRGKQPRYISELWTLDPDTLTGRELLETIATPHQIATIVADNAKIAQNKMNRRHARQEKQAAEKREEKSLLNLLRNL